MTHRCLMMIVSCLVLPGCSANGSDSTAREARPWDGQVQVHGALRAMMHEGQTGATVTLDMILPNPDLYALGALADLSGEVTVVAGKVYLSYPEGAEGTRTETTSRTNSGATLFVAADVPAWRSVRTDHPIKFEELDDEIAKLAAAAGVSPDGRFPFLLEGVFEDLRWHVVDGRRLKAGGASHQDHQAASIPAKLDRASAILIGFYSDKDQGVFTHMGSRTHIHCALDEPLASGHVDHVAVPAGTTVKFPVIGTTAR